MGQIKVDYKAGQYHRYTVGEYDPNDDPGCRTPHIADPDCWCGPTVTDMGLDQMVPPYRRLLLVDHILTPVSNNNVCGSWVNLNPISGTGPYSGQDLESMIEVVQTTNFVIPAKDMSDVETLINPTTKPTI